MFAVGQPGSPGFSGVLRHRREAVGATPAGRGPTAMYSLSLNVTLKFAELPNGGVVSFSGVNATVPSPGWRGSPGPPHGRRVGSSTTHGRLQVKPPFVERLTQTPFVSSVRLKLMSA